ncbi:MAG: hypothetical protein DMG05_19780 [Acidobacteria bacterium]|nr:MAG: hypothetical protein DMG05_19780 [Acidobacteriota bacterium]
MRLGGSFVLPISAGFEFFHTFRGSCEKGRQDPHQVAPWKREDLEFGRFSREFKRINGPCA